MFTLHGQSDRDMIMYPQLSNQESPPLLPSWHCYASATEKMLERTEALGHDAPCTPSHAASSSSSSPRARPSRHLTSPPLASFEYSHRPMASSVVGPVARVAPLAVARQQQQRAKQCAVSPVPRKLARSVVTTHAVDPNAVAQIADSLDDAIPTIAVVASLVRRRPGEGERG